ncbi:sensor histidine kinase [Undibacter mobilis]|uniref:sensor histidine kinase n=1 Tax=Undibacter mobilis TaxID=2292256 RepID=UPI0011C030CE|nr:CHASE3 domain-containing protein [Undibacter mobilis]
MPIALPRWRFLNLQSLLLGIGFLVLVGISAATIYLVERAATDSRELATTLSVEDKLSDILLTIRRAESSQRGYLLTNDAAYLDDFRDAEPETHETINELRSLSVASATRKSTLDRVAELVDGKFREMRRIIELNEGGRRPEALAQVREGQGRRLMIQLRDVIEEAIEAEGELAGVRAETSRRTNSWLLIVSLAGATLIVGIGAMSMSLVQRNYRRAEIARQELAGTNANLERIVEYRTADLTEANEEIQRFAYIVSHDLRSPLVNIMGFTSELEALRQDIFQQVEKLRAEVATLKGEAEAAQETEASVQLGRDFDEAIGFIKSSIASMDRLITAVLRLSREGRRQFNPERVDMNGLISGIIETVSHRATELNATLRVEELPPVETDLLAAQQIFGNLIDNALKYGRDDANLEIHIRGRLTAAHAIYEVQDNGRGIEPADFQRVFELFRRAGKQDRPGEGIGLAHVRALVRRLGGTMGLTSEPGKGSVFIVTLPRRWVGDNRSTA